MQGAFMLPRCVFDGVGLARGTGGHQKATDQLAGQLSKITIWYSGDIRKITLNHGVRPIYSSISVYQTELFDKSSTDGVNDNGEKQKRKKVKMVV